MLTKHTELYEGVLAQFIDVHPEHSTIFIVSCLPEEKIKQMTSLKEPDDKYSEESLS